MKEFKNYVNFKPGVAVRNYWESLGVKEEEVLFVDIETTGLSSKRDAIYQIGLAFQEKAEADRETFPAEKELTSCGASENGERAARRVVGEDVESRGIGDRDVSWIVLQWMCERRGEEQKLLRLFFERLAGYRLLMHFNGTTFDLPFLRQRASKYKNHFPGFGARKIGGEDKEFPVHRDEENLHEEISKDEPAESENRGAEKIDETDLKSDLAKKETTAEASNMNVYTPFDDLISADMFRIFSPLASFLGLPNKKQKSFEAFLGIDREDEMSGGDLIPVYCEYEVTGDERLEHYLMIHNHEDMKGMLRLTELFAYRSLREGGFRVQSFALQEDRDFSGRTIHELTARLRLDAPVARRFAWRADGFYFEAEGTAAVSRTAPAAAENIMRTDGSQRDGTVDGKVDGNAVGAADGTAATAVIRLEEGVMKHFFSNYRDYDYLIKEDMAVYRTVGDLVDPSLRKRATAETCYMKREGLFLRVGADCAAPLFRRAYKSRDVYVLAGEELDPEVVKGAVRIRLG